MAGSAEALERFQRQTVIPMLVLDLATFPLIVVQLLLDLPPCVRTEGKSLWSRGVPRRDAKR